ncbi:glycosyl hydrolases family 31-domain-containing protein, partial [Thamnocephalis sphaerospora]
LVTIVDPHIKNDPGYYVSKEGTELGYWVKGPDGTTDYQGWCWPGNSNWVDYMNPEARGWWIQKFAFDQYKYSTSDLHIWNDMNEPSVFNGPEITMPKDLKHFGGWEHRDMHNINGLLYHMTSLQGAQRRTEIPRRAFVLSRAFFSGTQRLSAVWTGDNMANWDHLALSLSMVLSSNAAGVPFIGADVGGFFGNPDAELLARWYQAGAFQPFFRAHAHIDSTRREPWLFEKRYMDIMREAIRTRYALLPYWYTVFRQSALTGMPIARPMFVEFPAAADLFGSDSQYMVGEALLVRPVTKPGVTSVEVTLPAGQPWFDYFSHVQYPAGQIDAASPLERTPVYIRGGSIVPTRQRVRSASTLMESDPFTLVVALDADGTATGELYVDDGETFEFLDGNYLHRRFTFKGDTLRCAHADGYDPLSLLELPGKHEEYATTDAVKTLRVERVIILGAPATAKWRRAVIESSKKTAEREVEVTCSEVPAALGDAGAITSTRCVIRDPATLVGNNWSIRLSA